MGRTETRCNNSCILWACYLRGDGQTCYHVGAHWTELVNLMLQLWILHDQEFMFPSEHATTTFISFTLVYPTERREIWGHYQSCEFLIIIFQTLLLKYVVTRAVSLCTMLHYDTWISITCTLLHPIESWETVWGNRPSRRVGIKLRPPLTNGSHDID